MIDGHPHSAQIHGVNTRTHGGLNGYLPAFHAHFSGETRNHEENGGRHQAPHHQECEGARILRAVTSNDEPRTPEKDKECGRKPLQGRRSH